MANSNMVALTEYIICNIHNVSQPAYFPQISNIQCNVIGTHAAVGIMGRFALFMKYYSSQQRQTNLISAVDYSLVEIDIVFMQKAIKRHHVDVLITLLELQIQLIIKVY